MNQRYLNKTYYTVLAVIFLSIALRLYNLGKASLWFDEAITLSWAENLGNIFKKNGCIPPLYYLLVYCWKMLGRSEFILRLLSVIFGIGSVLGVYFIGKLFFDTKTAIIAAFILAISPLHIFYSQELTVYSLFTFFVLVAVYFLKKALEDGRWIFWIGFSLFSALSILTHYIAILFLFSETLFFLLFWKRYRHLSNKWVQSHLLILAFLSPWLLLIIQQIIFAIKIHIGWWIPVFPSSLQAIAITFKNFSIGYNATPKVFFVTSVIYFSLFALGIHSVNKKNDMILLLCFTLVPILCAQVFLKLKVIIYVDRYFLPSSLFYYLIVARGLSRFKNRLYLFTALISIFILNSLSLKNYYLNYLPNPVRHHVGVQEKLDFRSIAYYIARNSQEGDAIIHTNENSTFSLEYYLNSKYCHGLKHFHYLSGEASKKLWAKFQDNLDSIKVVRYDLYNAIPGNQGFLRDKDISLEQYSRIWVIVDLFLRPEDGLSVLQYMDRQYKIVDKKEFYGLKICLYNKVINK